MTKQQEACVGCPMANSENAEAASSVRLEVSECNPKTSDELAHATARKILEQAG